MKRHFLMQIAIAFFASILILGCNKTGKQSKDAGTIEEKAAEQVEVIDAEQIKTRLIEIIKNSPKPLDIAVLIDEAGASYVSDLLLQDDEYEKMMTSTQKAFGIGVIGFDCKYTSVYNRPDEYLKCRSNLNRFIGDLGFQEVLSSSKKFEDRIDQNKSNADSLRYLVSKIVDNFNERLQNKENAEVYSLVFIGAHIQALYIVSQMTLMAENSEKLLDIINKQHEHAKIVASLLEVMSDFEHVKPYYEKIQPMVKFFAEKDVITTADLNEIIRHEHPCIHTKPVKKIFFGNQSQIIIQCFIYFLFSIKSDWDPVCFFMANSSKYSFF